MTRLRKCVATLLGTASQTRAVQHSTSSVHKDFQLYLLFVLFSNSKCGPLYCSVTLACLCLSCDRYSGPHKTMLLGSTAKRLFEFLTKRTKVECMLPPGLQSPNLLRLLPRQETFLRIALSALHRLLHCLLAFILSLFA